MNIAMTWLLVVGLTLLIWQGRSQAPTRRQPWRPREVWLPPPRCGNSRIDADNAGDRTKWMRVIVNRLP